MNTLACLQFKALKSTRRQGMSTSGFADDFADEVADLVDAAGVSACIWFDFFILIVSVCTMLTWPTPHC